jgi:hypothetical protein
MNDTATHLVYSSGPSTSNTHEPSLHEPLHKPHDAVPNSGLDDCKVHDFSIDYGEIGNGSFGTVTQVSCRLCNLVSITKPNLFSNVSLLICLSRMQTAACKTIRLKVKDGDLKARKKRERAMQAELDILGGLEHPNVLTFIAHEQSEGGLLRLYTEFCQYKDLEHQYYRFNKQNCKEFGE